jgi:hypothetical protein
MINLMHLAGKRLFPAGIYSGDFGFPRTGKGASQHGLSAVGWGQRSKGQWDFRREPAKSNATFGRAAIEQIAFGAKSIDDSAGLPVLDIEQ